MKVLLLLLLVCGLASASLYDALDSAVGDDFAEEMMMAPWMEDEKGLDMVQYSLKDDLQLRLFEALFKIKDYIEKGKQIRADMLLEVASCLRKLKNLGINIGERAKEIVKEIIAKGSEKLKDFMKIFHLEKRSLKDKMDEVLKNLHIRDLLERVRELINSKLNLEGIKEYLRDVLRNNELVKVIEKVVDYLGIKGLKDVVDRILGNVESRDKRSIVELWKKILEKFKDHMELFQEKFKDFMQWVLTSFNEAMEKAKDRVGLIKELAKKFIEDTKIQNKKVAEQALEFFQKYKDMLGETWNKIREKVANIRGGKY